MAASSKSLDPSEVKLGEINKFVGYKSDSLEVTLTETKGFLKKLVQEVKMIQKSIFPLRYYVYRRDSGTLHIYDKPDGRLKHEYHASSLSKVEKSQIVESANVAFPEDFPWLFLLTTETRNFYLYAATSHERDIWVHEFSNFIDGTQKLPDSFQKDIQDKIDPFL